MVVKKKSEETVTVLEGAHFLLDMCYTACDTPLHCLFCTLTSSLFKHFFNSLLRCHLSCVKTNS